MIYLSDSYLRLMRWMLIIVVLFLSCQAEKDSLPEPSSEPRPEVFLKVLGVTQDAGFPQIGCEKDCCKPLWKPATPNEYVVSLGLVDHEVNKKWMFEATPDFKQQLTFLNEELPSLDMLPDGIFLTHAHIGHYSGLMQLGRESIGAQEVTTHCMPRMADFLGNNGPWSQLVELQNIVLDTLSENHALQISTTVRVTPIRVPHRDEFSETVGYRIHGPNQVVFFVPDIDKWEKWDVRIEEAIEEYDVLLIDGTFFENGELPGRDMSEIPHPFIQETMDLLQVLPASQKAKIHFIHFNHTNPVLRDPEAVKKIEEAGFNIARQGQIIPL